MADGVKIPVYAELEDVKINSKALNEKALKKAIEMPLKEAMNEVTSAFNGVDFSQMGKTMAKASDKVFAEARRFELAQKSLRETTREAVQESDLYRTDSVDAKDIGKRRDKINAEYDAKINNADFMKTESEYETYLAQIEAKRDKALDNLTAKKAKWDAKLKDIYKPVYASDALEKWSEGEYKKNGEIYAKAFKQYQSQSKRYATLYNKEKSKIQETFQSDKESFDYKNFEPKAIQQFKNLVATRERINKRYNDLLENGTANNTGGIDLDPTKYINDSDISKQAKSNVAKAFNEMARDSDKFSNAVDGFNTQLETDPTATWTNAARERLTEIVKLEKEIIKLEAQIKQYNATGKGINPEVATFKKEELSKRYADLTSQQRAGFESGSNYNMPNFANVGKDLGDLDARIAKTTTHLDNLGIKGRTAGQGVRGSFVTLGKEILKVGGSITGVNLLFKLFGKEGKNGSTRAYSGMERFAKSIMQFGFGFRSLYYLVKQLRTAVITELGYMAAQIPAVNTQMSAMKTSLNQLKGSLATAFQPIIAIIVPALQTLTGWLTTAMNAIGRFFATLSGQGKIYKFTSATVDAASALGGAGKSAGKAKKQLDRTLLSFDKMNKLQKNDNSSGGGGGGAGANGSWVEDSKNAYSKLAALAKQAWKDGGDFTKVGEYVGQNWLQAMNVLNSEVLPKFDAFVTKVGKSIGTFFTGIFNTEGLGESIGESFARVINALRHGLNSLLDSIDFEAFGNFLGTAIAGLFNNLDLKAIAHTWAMRINGIWKTVLNAIAAFLETVDWSTVPGKIFSAIGEAFSTLDVGGIVKAAFRALGALVGAVASFIAGGLKSLTKTLRKSAKENANDTIEGFFQGIIDKIKGIGKWIKEHIFKPFIDGFKKAFGIASPSKKMKEQGDYVIEGFKDGILEKIKGFPAWLGKKVVNIVAKAFGKLKDFAITIKSKFADTKASLTKKWKAITANIKDITRNAKMTVKQKWSDIKNKWTELTKNLKDISKSAKMSVATKWSDLKSKWTSLTSNFKDISKTATLTLKAKASDAWNSAAKKLNAARKAHPKLLGWLPNLPYLAQGAVIPPNKEFAAILGDQKRGINIETPLDTMIEAFNTALAHNGMTGNVNVNVYLEGDAKGIFRVVRTEANNYTKSTGKEAFNI